MVEILPLIRMALYGLAAGYAIKHQRWAVWFTFTLLVFTTYIYANTGITPLTIEASRTIVALLLTYIAIRRK